MGINRFDSYAPVAINSILAQTLLEFEFIIVANGANCHEVAQKVRQQFGFDSRLRVLETHIPQLAYALNLAVDNAAYEFIARMDADDVSSPCRLERQLKFLLENNLDLVGCDVAIIDEGGAEVGRRITKKGRYIDKCLWYTNPFVHPTTLYRKAIFLSARGYNAGFNSEDYVLWLRLKRNGIAWDNIPDILLSYRVHSAASQRRLLGYAEVAGLFMREFLLNKNIKYMASIFIASIKALLFAR